MTGRLQPTGSRSTVARLARDWWVECLVVLLVAGAAWGAALRNDPELEITALELVAVVVAVILHRRRPVIATAAGLAAAAIAVVAFGRPTILLPAVMLALFAFAASRPRRETLIGGGLVTMGTITLALTSIDDNRFGAPLLAAAGWPLLATAAGQAVRANRLALAAANERAEQAERTRDAEAARQVVEERLRIARDVHDLVGHHLAVVSVQSGVAAHLVHCDPAAAAEAIGLARSAAATAAEELGEVLSMLRGADVPGSPTPSITSIEAMIDSFRASGLEIRHSTAGSPIELSSTVGVAAYRVVQEALTNAHRHGDGSATVDVRYDDTSLSVTIRNPYRGDAVTSAGGHGVIGMRERVESVGGRLGVDRGDGQGADGPGGEGHDGALRRFAVHAEFPGRAAAESSGPGVRSRRPDEDAS